MCPQVCRHAQRRNPNPNHQPAILRRHRRGSEGIGDSRKLLGAAPIEDGTDGTTMAKRKSSKTLTPQPAGQPSTAPHQRNAGPHRMERWPTSNGIQDPATRQDGNGMMLLDVLLTLFLTHVGHVANVRKQPASLRSDSGPLHRNTQQGRLTDDEGRSTAQIDLE